MKKLMKRLMLWTKEARVGVLLGAIALLLLGGINLAQNWWNPSTSTSSSSTMPTTSSTSTHVVLPIDELYGQPFAVDAVAARTFFDVAASLEDQADAVVFYDNRYMPSYGIDYIFEDSTVFPVIAACSGVVAEKSVDPIYGLTVVIESAGDIKTVYASLASSTLQVGQTVSKGQSIGTAGESIYGSELKTNVLHIELYKNDELLNPATFYGVALKNIQ